MATYWKRTSKLFDLLLSQMCAEVNLRDLMCPVCRSILIEPVTLPCRHNLCLRCLKGIFEHNSLSCPLCRVRVGSWFRTATKSETLVNNGLWELIRTKFPKEVQNKYNGEEDEIELDSGFTAKSKILSAAGEIRREYEVQLQMAEEEIRRQREAERIASEALIRKIQEEESQQLAQLAQDQLFAETLAKRQMDKDEVESRYCNKNFKALAVDSGAEKSKSDVKLVSKTSAELSKTEDSYLEGKKTLFVKSRDGLEPRKSNIALISKIRAERYASSVKAGVSNVYKNPSDKLCCQKSIPGDDTIMRTLKHQTVTKIAQPSCSNFTSEPSCSNFKIYGMQSKEELHVPSDVLNSKKKSLGVEVCVTTSEDDERIGSAESAASHDSINQEIHHFKPIKAMPRTPLKMSSDGKQIDPKLIRVIAILKRAPNIVPKPPSPTHSKRTLSCSWSAFRGKAKQNLKHGDRPGNSLEIVEEEIESKQSTSLIQSQSISSKSVTSESDVAHRRFDVAPEMSFDNNKNYAKNVNRVMNGTKVSKRLNLDECVEMRKVSKSWKAQIRNGTIAKPGRQKNSWTERKNDVGRGTSSYDTGDDDDELNSSTCSRGLVEVYRKNHNSRGELAESGTAIENIAEGIKKRKVNVNKNTSSERRRHVVTEIESSRRSTRQQGLSNRKDAENVASIVETSVKSQGRLKRKDSTKLAPRAKRQRVCRTARPNVTNSLDRTETLEVRMALQNVDSLVESSCNGASSTTKRSIRKCDYSNKRVTRNASKNSEFDVIVKEPSENASNDNSVDFNDDGRPSGCAVKNSNAASVTGDNINKVLDEKVIEEQERMEMLVLQEKKDFELARRLQAKFDEMETIAGRTRGSKRALQSKNIELGTYEVNTEEGVHKTSVAAHNAAEQMSNDQTTSSQSKQRRRPQRRALK